MGAKGCRCAFGGRNPVRSNGQLSESRQQAQPSPTVAALTMESVPAPADKDGIIFMARRRAGAELLLRVLAVQDREVSHKQRLVCAHMQLSDSSKEKSRTKERWSGELTRDDVQAVQIWQVVREKRAIQV